LQHLNCPEDLPTHHEARRHGRPRSLPTDSTLLTGGVNASSIEENHHRAWRRSGDCREREAAEINARYDEEKRKYRQLTGGARK